MRFFYILFAIFFIQSNASLGFISSLLGSPNAPALELSSQIKKQLDELPDQDAINAIFDTAVSYLSQTKDISKSRTNTRIFLGDLIDYYYSGGEAWYPRVFSIMTVFKGLQEKAKDDDAYDVDKNKLSTKQKNAVSKAYEYLRINNKISLIKKPYGSSAPPPSGPPAF